MFKFSNIYGVLGACIVLLYTSIVYSSERLLEADVEAYTEFNDNIFLVNGPNEDVTGASVTPSLSGVIKEENWEARLKARLKFSRYSDNNLDGNDQYFDLTGRFLAERDIYSLNATHNLDSNLDSVSSDFGITGRRVNRRRQSVTPSYTRLMTERLALALSYTYTDVAYLDAGFTGFTPYISQNGSASLIYDLTERNKLTVNLTAVDYNSKNDLITYQLFQSRVGIDHKFTKTLSTDFLVGVSRRNSTNLNTQQFLFFDQIVTRQLEVDSSNRGFVLDFGVTQSLENGQIGGRISRDNNTNSFGGLDQADVFRINYSDKVSPLWRYMIDARFETIESISSGTRVTDRDVLFFEARVFYSFSRNWDANASYRYIQRKFKSDVSDNRAPHSNRLYVGITYNFPSLSTF